MVRSALGFPSRLRVSSTTNWRPCRGIRQYFRCDFILFLDVLFGWWIPWQCSWCDSRSCLRLTCDIVMWIRRCCSTRRDNSPTVDAPLIQQPTTLPYDTSVGAIRKTPNGPTNRLLTVGSVTSTPSDSLHSGACQGEVPSARRFTRRTLFGEMEGAFAGRPINSVRVIVANRRDFRARIRPRRRAMFW